MKANFKGQKSGPLLNITFARFFAFSAFLGQFCENASYANVYFRFFYLFSEKFLSRFLKIFSSKDICLYTYIFSSPRAISHQVNKVLNRLFRNLEDCHVFYQHH